MNTMMKRAAGGAALAMAALLAFSGSAAAQSEADGWYPFLGCWAPESGVGPTVCIRPTVDGVELARVADGQVVTRETLSTRPEGVRSEREGCAGEHYAGFSSDRRRVFLATDYLCEGGGTRHETGLLALTGPDELLDVRSVDVEADEPVAWVQRYRATDASVGQDAGIADLPVPGMALETARRSAAASIDIDDVVEALDAVGPGALEAWVAETGDRFELDAATLVALSDEGVPEPVIDLMIAVSYPDRFALAVDDDGVMAQPVSGTYVGARPGLSARGFSGCYDYGWSSFYDPFYYGCGYGYRYSRYSYGPYGYSRGWYGYYNPGVVIVGGGSSSGATNGRVVRGRGYTRGGSSAGGSTSSGTSSGSVGSTRTGSSTAGSSTGSSSGTTRRAKPRRGGGGGGELLLF